LKLLIVGKINESEAKRLLSWELSLDVCDIVVSDPIAVKELRVEGFRHLLALL
jgi:hypothetical protein